MLIGLVLQLNRFWRENHQTSSKLGDMDEELYELETSATMLDAVHNPSSAPFYTHRAGGDNSQLLLGDLKSRLDLLSMKIGEQENG